VNPGTILLLALALLGGGWDLAVRRIPNWLTFPAMAAGLAWNFYSKSWPGLGSSGAGLALGAGILLPFFLLGGTGAGDVKMLAGVGAIVGWWGLLSIFIYFGLFGGIVALAIAITRGRFGAVAKNTGHLAALLTRARWREAEKMESAAPSLPYGAVIAVGCLLFVWVSAKAPA
jgi:prepilin peptidase CpaA